jgi:hypothetical protein
MRVFPSHGISFWLWGELVNPCFISRNVAFHEWFSFILVTEKIFKQSSHYFAFCSSVSILGTQWADILRKFKSEMISWAVFFVIPVTSEISRTFIHRCSLIKPSKTTQFSSACEVPSLPLCDCGSTFSDVRPPLNLLHHTDTSFRLKTFWL